MDSTRPTLLLTGYLLAAGLLLPCQAEITLDGSLGNEPGALTAGPNQEFNITEELGKKVGSNLFHSFGVFDIRSGETATFSGTSPIENILSRVTGGSASNIDGTLRTDFANATPNLFLINPAGVLFGPSASLDVQGSFHVSTADFLRLEDGVRYTSVPSPEDQVLTTAPPEAFGFVGESPSPITVQESILEVSEGEQFSIIGGDILVTGGPDGFIAAPSGTINMASLASSGEVNMDASAVSVNRENKQGDIEVTNDGLLNVSGAGGGAVLIRGGHFTLNNSNILANTFGDIDGGIVDIVAKDVIEILNGSRVGALVAFGGSAGSEIKLAGESIIVGNSSEVITETLAQGAAGEVTIEGTNLIIDLFSDIGSLSGLFDPDLGILDIGSGNSGDVNVSASGTVSISRLSQIRSETATQGAAGEISITSKDLVMDEDGRITASTFGTGSAGNIMVNADRVRLTRGSQISSSGGGSIPELGLVDFGNSGRPGSIIIDSSEAVSVSGISPLTNQGSNISSNTLGIADAGAISIDTPNLTVAETGVIQTQTVDQGAGGSVNIFTDELKLTGGGRIEASTIDPGNAGKIGLHATNVTIDGNGVLFIPDGGSAMQASGVFANTRGMEKGSGQGGTIMLNTQSLEIRAGGRITSNTEGPGKGGNIGISANEVILEGHDDQGQVSGIFANAFGEQIDSGGSGSILLKANDLQIKDEAAIANITNGPGNGGILDISASMIQLLGGGVITTDSFGSGHAGNIEIRASDVQIGGTNEDVEDVQLSQLSVSSQGTLNESGDGGDLILKTDNLAVTNGARISASTDGSGKGGTIAINSTQITLDNQAVISSESSGNGVAGEIKIIDTNNFRSNRSRVTTEASQADGGNIEFKVNNRIELNDSSISASVGEGGTGGNIDIDPRFVILDNSNIVAQAGAGGTGGNIRIVSDFIFQSPDSDINASSERGIDGTVDIDSPDTNISGSIAILPETYINAGDQLSERCGARSANLNSFTVKGRGAVPLAPEDFAPSTSQDDDHGGKISKNDAGIDYRIASYIESSSGTPGLTEKDGSNPQLTTLGFGCGE